MSESRRDPRDVRKILDHDKFRKKREHETVSIRKQQREELNLKRRMIAPSVDLAAPSSSPFGRVDGGGTLPLPTVSTPTPSVTGGSPQNVAVLAKMPVEGADRLQSPTQFIAAFQSSDPLDHLRAAHSIRRLLSLEKNPPIDSVIQSGCLPYLVHCLSATDNQKLQFEAAWALTNVASGDSKHTVELVKSGAVRPLLNLLSSPSWEIREQAVWALGNIAGDGAELRDQLLNCGAMQELINMMHRLLQENVPPSLVRNTAWTLSNMYRGKPSPPLELVAPGLPLLKILLQHHDDEVVIDTIWAVSYATECNAIDKPTPSTQMPSVDSRIDAVAAAGILPEIFRFITAPELSKALPSVRTFGNILTGSSKYTDMVLQMNILPPFLQVLGRKNRIIRKEVLWALSNVAAGTPEHVQALIDNGIINHAYSVITKGEFEVQKEAGWLVSNAAVCATPEQVQVMADKHHLLDSLAYVLRLPDTSLLKMALSSLDSVLQVGSNFGDPNPYAEYLQSLNIEDTLEKLQNHKNTKVYEGACNIIRDFFEVEGDTMDEEDFDDVDDSQVTPTTSQSALNFGPPQGANTGAPQFSFGASVPQFSFGAAAPQTNAPQFSFNNPQTNVNSSQPQFVTSQGGSFFKM